MITDEIKKVFSQYPNDWLIPSEVQRGLLANGFKCELDDLIRALVELVQLDSAYESKEMDYKGRRHFLVRYNG